MPDEFEIEIERPNDLLEKQKSKQSTTDKVLLKHSFKAYS